MKLIVDGHSFVSVMSLASNILSKSDLSSSVTFTTEGNTLYITVVTSIVYQGHITILEKDDEADVSVTVQLLPIIELFSKDKAVTISIEGNLVTLIQEGINSVCGHSDAIIKKREFPPITDAKVIDASRLLQSIRTLSNASAMKRLLRVEKPVNFYGDSAMIVYPTMVVNTQSSGIHSTVSLDDVKWISTFMPSHVIEGETLILYSSNGILQLPRSATSNSMFLSMVRGLTESVEVGVDGLLNKLRDLNKAFPREDCSFIIYSDGGLSVSVARATERVICYISLTQEKKPVFIMKAPIEYFMIALTVLNSSRINIQYQKGDKVCLVSPEAQVLMSLR